MILFLIALANAEDIVDVYRDTCRERILNLERHMREKRVIVTREYREQSRPSNFVNFKTLDHHGGVLWCGILFDGYVDWTHPGVVESFEINRPEAPSLEPPKFCWTETDRVCTKIHSLSLGDANITYLIEQEQPKLMDKWREDFRIQGDIK